ncbi:MAG: replicative DNA helicase [Opitutales bacterium]
MTQSSTRSSGPPKPAHKLYNIHAEAGLLAAILQEGNTGDSFSESVARGLNADAFSLPAHQAIWTGLVGMMEEDLPVDEISLGEFLKRRELLNQAGGLAGIDRVMSRIDEKRHGSHWLAIVYDYWVLREVDRFCARTTDALRHPVEDVESFLAKTEADLFSLGQEKVKQEAVPLEGETDAALEDLLAWSRGERTETGILAGLRDLDALTFGFHANQLIVLAARPSVGKTALALHVAESVALPRGSQASEPAPRVLFYSLEMGARELAGRILCSQAMVDGYRVKQGYIDKQERAALQEAATRMKKAPLYIDDSSDLTIMELRAKARREHARRPVGLIVVDYLQLIRSPSEKRNQNRENEIAEISRSLKALAKELRVPVLALSQLNRASEKDGRKPRLSDLRESGAIEQDADMVLLLSRPKEGSVLETPEPDTPARRVFLDQLEVRDLILAKHRNGPVGELQLMFDGRRSRFFDIKNMAPPES